MSRFIIISFAALGWCFYVMSGGSEFEPRGMRTEQPVPVAQAPAPKPTVPTQAKDLVTNVAARAPAVRVRPVAEVQEVAVVEIIPEPASLEAFSDLSVFDGQTANITLASLEDGLAGLRQVEVEDQEQVVQPPAPVEPAKDIRFVSGTRVNLRDGPGTIYPVITKLGMGQKVEILSDSGTGWLRLRVLPQQQVGWISASLVRNSSN